MEYLTLFLFVVVITALSIGATLLLERYKRRLIFLPTILLLGITGFLFISASRINDLGALAAILFGFVFLFSGLITLVVAAIRFRPHR